MKKMTPAEGLMAFTDSMLTIAEAIHGYRVQLESMGFSPASAELMSVQYHQHILNMIAKSASK